VPAPELIFLAQALVVVTLPVAILRLSGLKGLVPLVVVQILVGIALGPSLFGRVAPDLYETFFNAAALAPLSGIGSVAILVFGLITGLHVDASIFQDKGRATLAVATANVVVPTACGFLCALWFLSRHPDELAPGINAAVSATAIGVCIGMTALPVLGAILREMDLLGHRIGHLSLAISGINDAALWGLLVVVLAAANRHGSWQLALVGVLLIPVYLFVMIRFVRPLLASVVIARMQDGEINERALALVATVTIASALAAEAMGLPYILGSFVTGLVMPDNLRKPILDRLQVLTLALLMPFFFTLTGVRTLIDPASSAFVEIFLMSTIVAVVSIVGGTAIAARLVGESWRFALGLGALLQTKGLMELIVLTILRDAGIISGNVFAALVLMAVVTTALAMPLARLTMTHACKKSVT
jgi:Kef-type K+ transport system membrane component KefB